MDGVNLIDGFAETLVLEGFTSIPNRLLRSYANLGIKDRELIILLHLIYLRGVEGDGYPSSDRLQGLTSATPAEVEADLANLIEKKIVGIKKRVNQKTGDAEPYYSLEGLFYLLSEVWAIEKINEIEALKRKPGSRPDQAPAKNPENLPRIYKAFEKEFGRPFSPIEGELIGDWARDYPAELVLEALKIAVLNGTFSLRYIERILQDWQRKNVRTLEEVRRLEEEYIERKAAPKGKKGGASKKSPKEDKTEWNYGW
ncbi:MAG: DnaD domain protein [Firmicutes bacterium]|nr:DnaD domain protein [Bacillota bacterium]